MKCLPLSPRSRVFQPRELIVAALGLALLFAGFVGIAAWSIVKNGICG